MIAIAKLAAIGIALSLGAATAYELPVRKLETALGKYQDRLPAGEDDSRRPLLRPGKADRLSGQGAACLTRPPIVVTCTADRTVETRAAGGVSVLVRIPGSLPES